MDWLPVLSAELYLFLYIAAGMLHLPVFQQYVYARVSEQYHYPYDYKQEQSCNSSSTSNVTIRELQKQVQFITSNFQIGYTLCSTVPSVVVCLFLGPISDRIGRKPVILLTILGSCIESSLILLVMYMRLPIWLIFIAALFNGISGYMTGLVSATMSYVADVTAEEQRAVKMGSMEGVIFLGATVSSYISGHLIYSLGFINAYWFVWAFHLASLLYVAILLPESLPLESRTKKADKEKNLNYCYYLVDAYKILIRKRPQRWILFYSIAGTCFMHMLQLGVAGVNILYLLNSPLCMNPQNIGYAIGTRFLVIGIGSAAGLRLLNGVLPNSLLMVMGYLSQIGGLFILAFAKYTWMVYVAYITMVFVGFLIPVFRAISSIAVPAEEQGTLFSVMSSMEMIFVQIGTFLFNSFYPFANDVLDFAGAVYILDAAVTLLPVMLSIVYTTKSRQRKDYIELIDKETFRNVSSAHFRKEEDTSILTDNKDYKSV